MPDLDEELKRLTYEYHLMRAEAAKVDLLGAAVVDRLTRELAEMRASLPPAERYWEERYRDEKVEVDRLTRERDVALTALSHQTQEVAEARAEIGRAADCLENTNIVAGIVDLKRQLAEARAEIDAFRIRVNGLLDLVATLRAQAARPAEDVPTDC